MPHSWAEKTVVVTGGSSGLGLAIAREFAIDGARIVLVARNHERLMKAVEAFRRDGLKATAVAADITKDDEVQSLFDGVRSDHPTIDVLVNAAGLSSRAAILDTAPSDFQRLWELNFLGLVRCTREAAGDLIGAQGHVVNMGSLASKTASRFLGAYPASKFAVAAYSHQLRLELGSQGLHVLLVCPGPIRREDHGHRYDAQSAGLPESARRPGGGAKVKLIDPQWLARQVVRRCERRSCELIVPGSARWLFAISQLWPRCGDWILNRKT